MASLRQEKVNEQIKKVVANFLEAESNRTSLITVTSVNVSPDLKNAKILITVLPEEKEKTALDFCKRKRSEIKHEIKKKMSLRAVPFVDIELDMGEKNRQKIDELIIKNKNQ